MIQLTPQFTTHGPNARAERWEQLYRQRQFQDQRDERQRKERLEDNAEQEMMDIAMTTVIATTEQLEQFHMKLDTYDEITVQALIRNEQALEMIRSQMDALLSRAHVLEDGRRVFKTEDGTLVFDEHGTEVGRDVIDPDTIPDAAPKWEEFDPIRQQEQALIEEQDQLLEFQKKLDEAREASQADRFTQDDLDSLEAELEANMPPVLAQSSKITTAFESDADQSARQVVSKKNTFETTGGRVFDVPAGP